MRWRCGRGRNFLKHVGQTYENRLVKLDNQRFVNCTFRAVLFEFDGGPVSMDGCTLDGPISWRFGGNLGNGLQFLAKLYASDPDHIISMISPLLRSGGDFQRFDERTQGAQD